MNPSPAIGPSVREGGRPHPLRRLATLACLVASALGASACSGGGGGGFKDDPSPPSWSALKVLGVTAARRDDWERNREIEFQFSAPLPLSVETNPTLLAKAIQIGIVTPSGRIPAKGSFSFVRDALGKEIRTRLVFDPTRTQNADSLGCADNPFGFLPLTTYEITLPTLASSSKVLRAVGGDPISEEYSTFFTTGERYVKELIQPRYVGTDGEGAIGFQPPRLLTGEVPYNAKVRLVFDEPMDPAAFDANVLVVNDTLSLAAQQQVVVSGTFASDVCGLVWTFTPSFDFGGAGYDISVILGPGVKDLAGNPMQNPQTLRFRTEFKAGIPTVQSIFETFDTQLRLDPANTDADWGTTTPGVLTAGIVTTSVVAVALQPAQYPGGVRSRVRDHPFAQNGSGGVGHDQWLYTQAEVGVPGAITAMGWAPSSNALFASDHSKVKVTLGHTQGDVLTLNLVNNIDVGSPVKVADAFYTIPQRATIDPPCGTDACAIGYWPLPTFSNIFEYNGVNNLVVDIDATLGTNYQITRIFFGPIGFPNRHTWTSPGSQTASLSEPVVQDMQFTKKRRTTLAQSVFYDTGVGNPDFNTPVLNPSTQTGGTAAQVEFEGADGVLFPLPSNPNNVIPDPTTFTGWRTNVDQLDGKRFVRFRVTFVANVTTGQLPFMNSVSLPYIF